MPRRTPPTALLLGAGLLLTAGCTGTTAAASGGSASGGASATASGTRSGGSGATAIQPYLACLRQHGVPVPTGRPTARPSLPPSARPSGRPSGGFFGLRNDPQFRAAQQACASLAPKGGFGFGRGGVNSSALAAFRSCLEDHGVTLPTPSPGALGPRGGGLGELNRNDPKVAAALKICRPLLPSGFGRPGHAPGSPGAPASPTPHPTPSV